MIRIVIAVLLVLESTGLADGALPAPEVYVPPQEFRPLRSIVEVSALVGRDDAPRSGSTIIVRNAIGVRYESAPRTTAYRLDGVLELGGPFFAAAGLEVEVDPVVTDHTELGVALGASLSTHDHTEFGSATLFGVGLRARFEDRFFLAIDARHQTPGVDSLVAGVGVSGRPAYVALAAEGAVAILGGLVLVAVIRSANNSR